ncbi:hypothetical protein NI17_008775 [Thermobifida halotolerans]|uniref:Uncharacterized protein n=1 Tax=Thermobifida halotolerans TaxID=483545 RepID=A0A399G3T6_9ACTN|nr:hypothetical protein [Thermobifida halotolerans]UOE21214.1 hypothetical protein NI17_008775 [Thermobifida halotolerans]
MGSAPILAEDEYMHEPTDHPQFNESAYYNFVDGNSGFAVLIRMGNRVNEGHSEVTVLIYLPGGAAAIRFDRAPIDSNDRFEAAGLKFEVVEPLKKMKVTFDSTAHLLKAGTDLENPKRAFTTSPVVPVSLELHYDNVIPVYGLGDGSGIQGAEDSIAVGHYQGPCSVRGWVEVDGERREVDGQGFRDHSWGPRVWQGPQYWRWISCMVDERNGFVAWTQKIGDTQSPGNGMVLRDGVMERVDRVTVKSEYGGAPYYATSMRVSMWTESGERVDATGSVFHVVPLRNRRNGEIARLAEYLVELDYRGRTGYGISEYHDRIIEDIPAGISEA